MSGVDPRWLPADVDVIHVGNAFGEMFAAQGHHGAMPEYDRRYGSFNLDGPGESWQAVENGNIEIGGRTFGTLNFGGSTATTVSFILGEAPK